MNVPFKDKKISIVHLEPGDDFIKVPVPRQTTYSEDGNIVFGLLPKVVNVQYNLPNYSEKLGEMFTILFNLKIAQHIAETQADDVEIKYTPFQDSIYKSYTALKNDTIFVPRTEQITQLQRFRQNVHCPTFQISMLMDSPTQEFCEIIHRTYWDMIYSVRCL